MNMAAIVYEMGRSKHAFPGFFFARMDPRATDTTERKLERMALKGDKTPEYFECCPQEDTILVRFGS